MPPPPSLDVVRKLHETATKKLVEICQHCTAHDEGWEGYGDDEVKAAKQLLEQERQKIQR